MYVAHRAAVIAAWPVRSVSSETSVASSARDKARRDETRFFFSNEAFFITSRDACVPSFFPAFSRASEKTAPHCRPRVMEIHAFRLTPGQDLKKSLLSYAKGAKLEAACVVTCVGSLSKVSLRLAERGWWQTRVERDGVPGGAIRDREPGGHGVQARLPPAHVALGLPGQRRRRARPGRVRGVHHGGDGAGRVRRARLHA